MDKKIKFIICIVGGGFVIFASLKEKSEHLPENNFSSISMNNYQITAVSGATGTTSTTSILAGLVVNK